MGILNLEKYKYNYDKEADVLYISIGDPVPSYSDEQDNGVLIRYSIETDEFSGVTILDYTREKEHKGVYSYIPADILKAISQLIH